MLSLTKINLQNFRNLDNFLLELHPNLTIISGQNGLGKTNILESIHLLLWGVGIKETESDDLIQKNKNDTLVQGTLTQNNNDLRIAISLSKAGLMTKKIAINGVSKGIYTLHLTTPPVVLFTPKLLFIIDTDQSNRRKYFDSILSRVHPEYKRSLSIYTSSLTKRNKILEKSNKININLSSELKFWDDLLISNASTIQNYRKNYIEFANSNPKSISYHFNVKYSPNEITISSLAKSHDKSILTRRTLVGPQRDEFVISIANPKKQKDLMDVHKFGSRSEQRIALYWLKGLELKYFEENLSKKPILLLDDITSELDELNKNDILSHLENYQTILTTVEEGLFKNEKIEFNQIKL